MPPKRPMSASPLAKRIKTTKTTKSATPLSAQVASRRIKEEKGVVLEASTAKKSPLTRTPTVKRQHLSINDGSPSSPSPSSSSWRSVYDLINEWRLEHPAPVDTMGCERIAETDKGDKIFRYQTLVSLQLSSQTKDTVNAETMRKLQTSGVLLSPQSILDMSDSHLNSLISKVGFHNRKTIYLKQTAKILLEKYDGDIPSNLEELCALPGVGPKMAHLALQCAWKINSGIGVDTHVHRISQRLGWVKYDLKKTPEQTRMELEEWLPREYWAPINPLLVGFGQTLCLPIGPKCDDCPARHLCPKRGTKSKSPKK